MRNKAIMIIGVIIFGVLYFILGSKELFRQVGGGFIPSLYYPIGIILSVIISLTIWGILHKSFSWKAFVLAAIMIFTFSLITLSINSKYGFIMRDYYSFRKDYKTLLGIIDYSNKKGNYITIYKEAKKEDIKVKKISTGYNKNYPLTGYVLGDNELSYNINGEYIISFNWDEQYINECANIDNIIDRCIQYMVEEFKVNKYDIVIDEIKYCQVRGAVKDKEFTAYIFSENGEFKFAVGE